MWVLFIIVFSLDAPDTFQVLDTFRFEHACLQERDRVWLEMKKAYPGDNDYVIDCQPAVKTTKERES
jgi:hypothetical protein